MTRILIVRHGESEWNAVGRWQGHADPPLTSTGRRQARAAAAALGAVDAVVASDLRRARHTAELMAEELGVGPVVVDHRLRERDVGEWSGLTRAEVHLHWPGYLADDPLHAQLGDDQRPDEQRPPSWEGDQPLLERVLEVLGAIAHGVPGGDVLAVSHGGVIATIEHHLGAPRERVPNLGARWLVIEPGARPVLGPRVALLDHADSSMQDVI